MSAAAPGQLPGYWSEELESLHEESGGNHFLDVWTRRAMLAEVDLSGGASVLDIGCASGHLLEEAARANPAARAFGVDFVFSGLPAAAKRAGGRLCQADIGRLPFAASSFDAVLSANVLEHVPDDTGALAEIKRVLRPGGRCALVVPAAPSCFDYYDAFLGHQRRYRRRELAEKAAAAGLSLRRDTHLGFFIFPPFFLVKQKNRLLYRHLAGEALKDKVARDIAATRDSRLGRAGVRLEEALAHAGVALPIGVRELVVLEAGRADGGRP